MSLMWKSLVVSRTDQKISRRQYTQLNSRCHYLDSWSRNVENNAETIGDTQVFLCCKEASHKFFVQNDLVHKVIVDGPICYHEEVDTQLAWHLYHICLQDNLEYLKVSVRADDTNVFIVLLYYARNVDCHVYMDAGKSSNNNR